MKNLRIRECSQKQLIEGQTTKWPKEEEQEDKLLSTTKY
jgi:hypothetical protein